MNIMNVSLAITLLTMTLLSGCNSKSNNNATVYEQPQVEKFSDVSRAAFAQASASEPLKLNSLIIENDVTSADFYDDLLMTQ
jgi:hypothetical protein